MLYQKIHEEYLFLQHQISEIQETLKTLPDGKLICSRGRNCFKWYKSDGHSQVYLPKSERKLAEQLAAKKYLTLTLEQLTQEKAALEYYLRHHKSPMDTAEKLLVSHLGYQELLAPYFTPKKQAQKDWMETSYERNLNHPEALIHKTSFGLDVRSKSESMIAVFLHTNHIPFRYECALYLGGITFYPDFTILHPHTSQILYWEHFGKMDDPTYIKNTCSKLQRYATYGIVPSIQLITTYETKEHPLSYEEISRIASHYFL